MTRPEHAAIAAMFRALSARLGSDPLQVQGPGGNTSWKDGDLMWIKASGTSLADAVREDIFVAVDLVRTRAQIYGAGCGTITDIVIDPDVTLRPSIETTFHALLDWPVVIHTHSIATLAHAISPQGLSAARIKLSDLPVAFVPYRMPGTALTRAIADVITPKTQIIVLRNHGLVVAGPDAATVDGLRATVEDRLKMPVVASHDPAPANAAPPGFTWDDAASILATDPRLMSLATTGSYYPDHVVFLGPALPKTDTPTCPVILIPGSGVALRIDASASQRAMLTCLADVLTRMPSDWVPTPIGPDAERALLDWDAEKYRQAMAARAC